MAAESVVSEEDLCAYANALERNGFFGPNSWYMNDAANAAYAAEAVNGGCLDMPVLFRGARYDYALECVTSKIAEPMRRDCRQLDEAVLACGHWMAQERPLEVNALLARRLATKVADSWPTATVNHR